MKSVLLVIVGAASLSAQPAVPPVPPAPPEPVIVAPTASASRTDARCVRYRS